MKLIQDILKDSGHVAIEIRTKEVIRALFGYANESTFITYFPALGIIVNEVGYIDYLYVCNKKVHKRHSQFEVEGVAKDVILICYSEYIAMLIERENNVR